ncbi:MAG TPA: hypothetical protein VM470_05485 [Acidimicrobiia bacterium]|nr:hypothetical protein [Acidimicrobiia bacterium]
MSDPLPFNPNISQLKKRAKDLKRNYESGNTDSLNRVQEVLSSPVTDLSLRDAQLVIAREHGFKGWHDLIEEAGQSMVDRRDVNRWFGVHLNNGAWDQIEAGVPDADNTEEEQLAFLYGAFASAFHWSQVGGVANRARAEHLISRVALQIGYHEIALDHARRCLRMVTDNPGAVADWDLGFALEALARALAATGNQEEATERRVEAKQATAAVANPDDQAVLETELSRGPWFGLDE